MTAAGHRLDLCRRAAAVRRSREQGAGSDARLRADDRGRRSETGALVNVFGGKLTTHRRLSEEVLERIEKVLGAKGKPWTKGSKLPGGEFGPTRVRRAGRKAQRALSQPRRQVPAPAGAAVRHARRDAARQRQAHAGSGRTLRRRPDAARGRLSHRATNGRARPTTCCGGAPSSGCASAPATRRGSRPISARG